MQTIGIQEVSPLLTVNWDHRTFTVNDGTHLETYQFAQLKKVLCQLLLVICYISHEVA